MYLNLIPLDLIHMLYCHKKLVNMSISRMVMVFFSKITLQPYDKHRFQNTIRYSYLLIDSCSLLLVLLCSKPYFFQSIYNQGDNIEIIQTYLLSWNNKTIPSKYSSLDLHTISFCNKMFVTHK